MQAFLRVARVAEVELQARADAELQESSIVELLRIGQSRRPGHYPFLSTMNSNGVLVSSSMPLMRSTIF